VEEQGAGSRSGQKSEIGISKSETNHKFKRANSEEEIEEFRSFGFQI
jgi:hypothetical protein